MKPTPQGVGFFYGSLKMVCSAKCGENGVKLALMRRSFKQAERPAMDGRAGAKAELRCWARDGRKKVTNNSHQVYL